MIANETAQFLSQKNF